MSHGGDHITEPIGSTSKKAFNTDANSVHKSPAKVPTHSTHYQGSNDDKTSSMAAPVTTKRGLNTSISLVDHRSSLSSDHPLQREVDMQQCQVETNAVCVCVCVHIGHVFFVCAVIVCICSVT